MLNPFDFDVFGLIPNRHLRWTIGSLVMGAVDMVVFVGCLQAENTRCAAITGILGVVFLCVAVWHGLIYIAQRKAGF